MPTGSWTGTFCSAAAPSSTDEFAIFSYHDDDNTNDIPDTEAAIGSGFSNANAFFIGNDQLRKSELTGLKLCIEVRPSCHFSQCVDIYESEWTYCGADEHIGRLEFPSFLLELLDFHWNNWNSQAFSLRLLRTIGIPKAFLQHN